MENIIVDTMYETDKLIIGKDYHEDLYIFDKTTEALTLLSRKGILSEVVFPNDDHYLFLLNDYIKVIDLNQEFKGKYQSSIYQSSYYMYYSGVTRRDDYYTVNTDDGDIIAVYFKNGKVLFQRVFDYELINLDRIMGALK